MKFSRERFRKQSTQCHQCHGSYTEHAIIEAASAVNFGGEGSGKGKRCEFGGEGSRRAPLVAKKLRVHASARLVLLTQCALDAVLVSLVALVVRSVVLRLGHFL